MMIRASAAEDVALLREGFCAASSAAKHDGDNDASLSFALFAGVWQHLRFECIHVGCVDDRFERRELLLELFEHTTLFIREDAPLATRVGAVFTLFALYETQLDRPKVRIRASRPVWAQITALLRECDADAALADCARAITSLCASAAFDFVLSTSHRADPYAKGAASGPPIRLLYQPDSGAGARASASSAASSSDAVASTDEARLLHIPLGVTADYAKARARVMALLGAASDPDVANLRRTDPERLRLQLVQARDFYVGHRSKRLWEVMRRVEQTSRAPSETRGRRKRGRGGEVSAPAPQQQQQCPPPQLFVPEGQVVDMPAVSVENTPVDGVT